MDLAFSTPITSLKNGHCKWLSNRVPRSYREGTVYLPLRRCYWPTGTSGKEPACQRWRCKSCVFDLWVVKIPWRRKWHPLRYSCLGNPMDRGAWQVTVHGAAKSQTQLSDWTQGNRDIIATVNADMIHGSSPQDALPPPRRSTIFSSQYSCL